MVKRRRKKKKEKEEDGLEEMLIVVSFWLGLTIVSVSGKCGRERYFLGNTKERTAKTVRSPFLNNI